MSNPLSKKHFSFDLDGTIIDSQRSINDTIRKCFGELNIKIDRLITAGPSLDDFVRQFKDIDEDTAQILKERFIYHYDSTFCTEARLFPSVRQTLHKLREKDFHLTLATNKRTTPTLLILNELEIRHLFSRVHCIDTSENYTSKSEALQNLSLPGLDEYYVGDLPSDYYAAQNAYYNYLYASWGYGNHIGGKVLTSFKDLMSYT